jgi:endo-1,4-beta-xylanase
MRIALTLAALAHALSGHAAEPAATLRGAAARTGFFIGTNTDKRVDSYEPEYGKTIAREFNTLSTTASMWMLVHPDKESWDFAFLDSVVAFAKARKMRVLATPIMWGSRGVDEKGNETWNDYNPAWLSDQLKPEELKAIMRDHITKLVSRYKGKVHEWVVVNEPFEFSDKADAPAVYRDNVFARRLGAVDYMAEAFKIAHAADPQAVLILNDEDGAGLPKRAEAVYELTRELLKRGAPVHAVGMQMHWVNFFPKPAADIEKIVARLAGLGVKVKFTELDVMVSHLEPEKREAEQARLYARLMDACLGSPACDEVVFWGFTDKHNWWVDEMGYKDEQPLLFNAAYERKPSYFAVLKALEQSRLPGSRSP